jgi:YaiO family outer membrane protein
MFKNSKIYKIIVCSFFLILWYLNDFAQVSNYDEKIQQVKEFIKRQDFSMAEELLRELNKEYPKNSEILFLLGKTLFWQGKYAETLEVLREVYHLSPSEEVEKEIEKVEITLELRKAENFERDGMREEAKRLYLMMFEQNKNKYESGYKLGMIYFKEKDYKRAKEIFENLMNLFPEDIGFKELYAEALILSREYGKAKKFLFSQSEEVKDKIKQRREDLFCRVRTDFIKISSASYSLSPSTRQPEKEYSIEMSQKLKNLSFVLNLSDIKRYGLNDKQIHLDIYSSIGKRSWGYLSFYYSPDADFLPQTVYGGEIYQGYKNFEFSLGYTHMNFRYSKIDILYPGLMLHLPHNFVLREKFYYVPKTGSSSLVNSLGYNPKCKVWFNYFFGIGNLAEKLGAYGDILKYRTFYHRIEGEFRFQSRLTLGLEGLFEHRQGLYDKKGVNLFLKYWW